MIYVETSKKNYICDSVGTEDNQSVLTNAAAVDYDDAATMADTYMRAHLSGTLKTVKLSKRIVESTEEAEETATRVEMMMKFLPIAEKNARADTIMKALNKLMDVEIEEVEY